MSEGNIINFANPKSPTAEAYRTLRTNLQFIFQEKSIKSLMVTSACPGEGKSTTVANLALSVAQTGKKVLIVDCDLRKPQQHRIFNLDNEEGLSNLLIGELYPERVIKETHFSGVKVMTAGPLPPNPAELLGSQAMGQLMNSLKNDVELVIIDTPPVVAVTDAAVVAAQVDGIILVISAGATKIELIKKAKELLSNVKANILGVVLNKMAVVGQGYYYYYTDEGQKKKKRKSPSSAKEK